MLHSFSDYVSQYAYMPALITRPMVVFHLFTVGQNLFHLFLDNIKTVATRITMPPPVRSCSSRGQMLVELAKKRRRHIMYSFINLPVGITEVVLYLVEETVVKYSRRPWHFKGQ